MVIITAIDDAFVEFGACEGWVAFGAKDFDEVEECGFVVWRGEDRGVDSAAGHWDVADGERVDDDGVCAIDDGAGGDEV
ncbi:hypothetical protein [Pengzhenrongella sicca]|uniref:Uncharacterized protein n=1 Tax=Pengzhenrongella sicca TaxID=2819238 RepID=A0A8A4Z9G1_9MICO|nr:hypothetical protein [Pengzhenrongella sicca]QTE28550.1 hypothetical protein J4E96_14415 [Pengzhenrongella sicca]